MRTFLNAMILCHTIDYSNISPFTEIWSMGGLIVRSGAIYCAGLRPLTMTWSNDMKSKFQICSTTLLVCFTSMVTMCVYVSSYMVLHHTQCEGNLPDNICMKTVVSCHGNNDTPGCTNWEEHLNQSFEPHLKKQKESKIRIDEYIGCFVHILLPSICDCLLIVNVFKHFHTQIIFKMPQRQ